MRENRFLVGNLLREVRNGRLNCNNASNESSKGSTNNTTYVKKIRRRKGTSTEVFPYASSQNQKKAMKEFAKSQGKSISMVKSASTTEAVSEGNPYKNWDEDIMGFMIAKAITITEEEYNNLDEKDKVGYKKEGKKGYKKDVTKKRRAKLMMSSLQAIGHTRIAQEFCTRQTDETPILYEKEVYSTDMSSAFILDVADVGRFNANDNQADYRDYNLQEAQAIMDKKVEDNQVEIELDREERIGRIEMTLEALRVMNSRTTMTNNLEDLSARFIIMAEYSIGSSVFSGIFSENRLNIEFLRQAIEENEKYRLSNIFIGVREEYMEKEGTTLAETLRFNFGDDDRIIITGVSESMSRYMNYIRETLK